MAEPRHPQLVFRGDRRFLEHVHGDLQPPVPEVGVPAQSQPVYARERLHRAKRRTLPRRAAANLQWGASIPNPSGRPVEVSNAKGIVCWDLKAPGYRGGGGPLGNGGAAGAGFLAEDDPAGALIMRTQNGHTRFSVNGRGGASFKDNEGFYEFDLKMK